MTHDTAEQVQVHSEKYVAMTRRRERCYENENSDGYGKKTGECGDTVEFFLDVREGVIDTVTFQIDGCLHTMACANTVTIMVEGRSVAESWDITPEIIIKYLETLPDNHHHCAELAVGAFYLALASYHELQRQPWKTVYGRR